MLTVLTFIAIVAPVAVQSGCASSPLFRDQTSAPSKTVATAIESEVSPQPDAIGDTDRAPALSAEMKPHDCGVCYVIVYDEEARMDRVRQVPLTDGDTVLDVIARPDVVARIHGTTPIQNVWIERPSGDSGTEQILPVDWSGIHVRAQTATNYRIMPDDRIFITKFPATRWFGKVTDFWERMVGMRNAGNP
jgi:hypothetical protein